MPALSIQEVVDTALGDFDTYLSDCAPDSLRTQLRQILDENLITPESGSFHSGVRGLFTWLDGKFEELQPLVNGNKPRKMGHFFVGQGRLPMLVKESNFASFLRGFYLFLAQFAPIDEDESQGSQILNFAHFIVKRLAAEMSQPLNLFFMPMRPDQYFSNFISWLWLRQNQSGTASIYIYYNANLFEKVPQKVELELPTDGIVKVTCLQLSVRARQKILIHEVGHIRLHLKTYFLDKPPGESALPHHESEAWSYAGVLQTCAIAYRSRIQRYLGGADWQWLA